MIEWLCSSLTAWQMPLANCPAVGLEIRAALAAGANFLLALMFGPRLIEWLRRRFREPVASPSPDVQRLHAHKQATPTMGGLFIVAAIVGSLVVFGDWHSPYLPLAVVTVVGLGCVGLVDDLVKIHGNRRGISARAKLAGQTLVAAVVAIGLIEVQRRVPDGLISAEAFVGRAPALGWWSIPWSMLVIVAGSNAVNLTDGLDGLAGGCVAAALAALAVTIHVVGSQCPVFWLDSHAVPNPQELTVAAVAALGAVLGFLKFNRHPAQVFMGDTGSLALGGLLGLLALSVREELTLILVGGVFVVETASVIAQVAMFRSTGRRIFLCAPLHHHFQLLGWPERKIVARFWIAAAMCAACGLTLVASRATAKSSPRPDAVADGRSR